MPERKGRYIKTVVFNSLNDVKKIETVVNKNIEAIKIGEGQVISIVPHAFGLSPMNLIYNIIYERTSAFEDKEFNELLKTIGTQKGGDLIE